MVSVKCFACGGPFHEATGHVFKGKFVGVATYCGPCARHFFAWVVSHTKRRWGGLDFYAEAAKKGEEIK